MYECVEVSLFLVKWVELFLGTKRKQSADPEDNVLTDKNNLKNLGKGSHITHSEH